jgi:hypothetical protein
MATFPLATTAGLLLMLAYPLLILGYDALLKFAWRDPTITADVSSSRRRRVEVCLYLGLWTVALGLHFLLGWFDGFAPE